MSERELRQRERAAIAGLIRVAREAADETQESHDRAMAIELTLVALSMTAAHQRAALFIAAHFCSRRGIDGDEVLRTAITAIGDMVSTGPVPEGVEGDE